MPNYPIEHDSGTTTEIAPACFIAGESRAMKTLETVATEIACTNLPVLILGESGTGKRVLAHRIHEMSVRGAEGVLRLVCGAVTAQTFASQLRLGEGTTF